MDSYYREQEANRSKGLLTFSGPYCFPDPHPPILRKIVLLAGFTFILLLIFRNYFWAIPAALLTFAMYPYWYWDTQVTLSMAEFYEVQGIDLYFIRAGWLDLAGGFLTSVLAVSLLILASRSIKSLLFPPKLP
jgi:hypothetical protein